MEGHYNLSVHITLKFDFENSNEKSISPVFVSGIEGSNLYVRKCKSEGQVSNMLATASYSHIQQNLNAHNGLFSNLRTGLNKTVARSEQNRSIVKKRLNLMETSTYAPFDHLKFNSYTSDIRLSSDQTSASSSNSSDSPVQMPPSHKASHPNQQSPSLDAYELSLDEIAQRAVNEWNDVCTPVLSNKLPAACLLTSKEAPSPSIQSLQNNEENTNKDLLLRFLEKAPDSERIPEVVVEDDDEDILIIEETSSFPGITPLKSEQPPDLPYIIPGSVCSLQNSIVSFEDIQCSSNLLHKKTETKCKGLAKSASTCIVLTNGTCTVDPCHNIEQSVPSTNKTGLDQIASYSDSSDEIEILGCFKHTKSDFRNSCSKITFMRALGLKSTRAVAKPVDNEIQNERRLRVLRGRLATNYMKNDRIPLSRVRPFYEYVSQRTPAQKKKKLSKSVSKT